MNTRIFKKVFNVVYNSAAKGDFKSAYGRLQKIDPNKQRQIINLFNDKAIRELDPSKGIDVAMNFAAYRGLQEGLKKVGGAKGIAKRTAEEADKIMKSVLSEFPQQVMTALPQTTAGWYKLIVKEKVNNIVNLVKKPIKKHKTIKVKKNIPDEFKPIFVNLQGKTGQEFVDTAYENIVVHMNLKGIAPKNIVIKGNDGLMNVTGGYDQIGNTIRYSKGFLETLSPEQQINLISHELKHCEQFTTMLRTEGIGVNEYARVLAENSVKNALSKSSFDISAKRAYMKACESGKGEQFIQEQVDILTNKLIPEIKENFSEVLKMPKIQADSAEGINAYKHLEAMRNYEGIDLLGVVSENYRKNLLELEAYAYGDSIEQIFKKFVKV